MKIDLFNDVAKTREILSETAVGKFGQWKNEYNLENYLSATYYFPIISPDDIHNNIAMYLSSRDRDYVESLKIILNVNDERIRVNGLTVLDHTSKRVFDKIGVEPPFGLSHAIKDGCEFNYSNSQLSVSLKIIQTKLTSFELKITSK